MQLLTQVFQFTQAYDVSVEWIWVKTPGDCLSIKELSYQYKDSNYKDKTHNCLFLTMGILIGIGYLVVSIFIPPPNEVGGGVYWIHPVRLSVCPSVCL